MTKTRAALLIVIMAWTFWNGYQFGVHQQIQREIADLKRIEQKIDLLK